MNGLPRSKEGGIPPSELANMLRKSADIVDRKEFHPLLYQTMRALTSYAGEYADGGISTATAATTNGSSTPTKQQQLKRQGGEKLQQQQQQAGPTAGNNNNDPPGKKTTSVFADVPDSILDGGPNNNAKSAGLRSSTTTTSSSATNSGGGGATAAAERVGAPGGQFASASAAAGGNKSDQSKGASSSSHKGGVFSLKGIKKGIEKLGTDVHKFVGELDHHVCLDNNSGTNNKDDVPFDEYAWCDEHFTRGCACKTRNAHQKSESSASIDSLGRQQQQQQQQQQQGPSLSDAGASSTTESPDDKPSKPCFQRPINPSSNLIANGWIEQQRRSKMRVVWKDVLASLVEGRRPGEETTLWIQRQVIHAQTGKVTGLEALHQIPMKWLEDVNYVDLYGDHRFTLKVYNIAEEFYFRTRDESSAQSWVVTLRSARDASLESTHRIEGGVGGADADEEIINNTVKPSAKEMGLDDVEDWDLNKQSDQEGGRPQAGSDSGGDSRPSSAPQPQHQSHSQQQQQQQPQPRLKISELRAIAHGAGYDTRGMERQDLERIAAHVRGGAAAALPTSPDDNIKQSMQREKEMREAEQRAAAERREREMQEEARVEKMRRDREETERRRMEEAAEQQRRRQQEFEAQAAEIKRKQEEERQRKMAELRAQQQVQQQQYQQAQAEEQRRRAQAQHQAHIPSPPVSGGQTNFQSQPPQWGQPQQAYHQQQQAWQQQQQHHQQQQQQHFQHQGLNRTTTQNHAQQAWQQQHQQHAQNQAWQQQQHQQQQQQQQQQRPPQPPPNNTQGPSTSAFQSKYAKQMEDKDDEDQPAATLQIKRSILINWALQPPNLNVLRPIDQLITTIHKAMPPAYGVAAHAYFAKFTPIAHSELVNGPHPDETKMKKAVRKVRVFLHPDKLPRDLSSDQAFMARMLWDITSDSWEEFQKHKDELDWIRS